MGVKDLSKELQNLDTDGTVVIKGLPDLCSIAVIDAAVLFYRLSAIISISLLELLDMLRNKIVVWAAAPNARALWYLVDYPNVTKRKSVTQAARAASRKKQGVLPYPDTVEIRDNSLYDTATRKYLDDVAPARLAASRHLRHQFSDALWKHICKGSYPDHVAIFFDAYNERAVPMLNGGCVTLVPQAVEITAEGEVRGVLRARQMLSAYPNGVTFSDCKRTTTDIVMQTVDGDAVPLLVEHFWEYKFPDDVSLSLVHKAEMHINVVKLIEKLKADGWTWQMFKVACVLSGTDYSVKKHYTDGVGGNVAWQAWRAIARNIPMEVKTDYRRVTETMICSAYVAKVAKKCTTRPSTRKEMNDAVRSSNIKALHTHIFNDSEREAKGKDNMDWLWEYWGSLGRNVAMEEKKQQAARGQFGAAVPVAGYQPPAILHRKPQWLWGGGAGAAAEQKQRPPAAVAPIEPEYVPADDDQEMLVAFESGVGTTSDVAALCIDLT